MAFFPLPCSAYFAPLKLYLSILESSSHKLRARPTWLARFPRSRIASLFFVKFQKFRSVHMKSRVGPFFCDRDLGNGWTVSHRKTPARVTCWNETFLTKQLRFLNIAAKIVSFLACMCFYCISMRINFFSKVTRVHEATNDANDTSLCFTILALSLEFHSSRLGLNIP